jgi:hypothetical protein
VDLAKKRRGGCSEKRPSYYMVERTVVFSECTLPVQHAWCSQLLQACTYRRVGQRLSEPANLLLRVVAIFFLIY